MSTRSLIAIPIDDGNAAIGRYHHSDGYPTGLGTALFAAYKQHKNYASVVQTLVFDHPAGWATIVNSDWGFAPGYVSFNPDDADIGRCCEQPHWRHYAQYYERNGAGRPPDSSNPIAPAAVLGHPFIRNPLPTDNRPRCYCHGEASQTSFEAIICRTEAGSDWCEGTTCDPLDLEWAYRLYPQGVEVWEARQPSPEYTFRHYRRARVSWDEAAPSVAMSRIEAGQDLRDLQWSEQMDALATAVKAAREGL